MINIIFSLLVVHYIGVLIFKPKSSTLNCGIFAWAGKSTNKFDKVKFDLLGTMNEVRGVDSCGVSIDGDIFNGTDKQKVYRDFIVDIGYNAPKELPVVLGHTRKSTYGAHTLDNAHPFGFGHIKKGDAFTYGFIGVHNGTLLNHLELASNFNVRPEASVSKGVKRTKIDSEIILEAIYRNNSFKVLEEYNGAAALVFTNIKEPNVIYCYHGASKHYRRESGAQLYIERPLFYWKESRNSLYISSLENSLFAIGGSKENIGEFDTNVVYKITDGNIAKAEKIEISRIGNFIFKTNGETSDFRYTPIVKKKTTVDGFRSRQLDLNYESEIDYGYDSGPMLGNHSTDLDWYNIYEETIPKVKYEEQLYFHKLRFWKEGKLANGVYTWIKGFGYYYLGDRIKDATTYADILNNKYFVSGAFEFGDVVFNKDDGAFIPFPGLDSKKAKPMYYFHEGVQLISKADYLVITSNPSRTYYWHELAHCSTHPVINLAVKNSSDNQNILFRGGLAEDTICPLGSSRLYSIQDGNCFFWEQVYKPVRVGAKEDAKEVSSFTDVVNELNKNEKDISNEEFNKLAVINNVNNNSDLANELINEIFSKSLMTMPLAIKRLSHFTNNEEATTSITIIENFLDEIKKVINLEPKE